MSWLHYLLEANFYLLVFFGFYRFFLHRETFYSANRYYLLAVSCVSFLLPIFQIGELKPVQALPVSLVLPVDYVPADLSLIATGSVEVNGPDQYYYGIYLCVAAALAFKLIMNLSKIVKLATDATKTHSGDITWIELDQQTAFSFFNLLFIHPQLANKKNVVNHEMVHIKQKHSIDILFFELLQIICWFNPIIYFLKKDIRLLHEYIADDLTTQHEIHKHDYALFLIENSFGVNPHHLANQFFNQSILKRRINMLNKKKTAERARLRFLLALPLAGGMLCASTVAFTKDYGYVDLLPEKSESTLAIFQDPPQVIQSKQINPLPPVGRKPARAARPLSPNKRTFITQYEKDKKTGTLVIKDQRLVLVNGNVMDLKSFYGVTNAETIHYSGPSLATKKFGLAGKSGAVEITGKNLRYFKQPVESSEIKFPPPVLIERRAKPAVRKLQVEPSKIIAADTIKEIRLKKGIIYASATRKVPLRLANSRVIEFREIPQRHTDSLRKVKLKLNPTRAKKNEIIEIRLKEDEKPKELIFQLKEKPAG